MSDGDDLMTTPQEALRGLLMTPCDCAEDWTARNRHAPDCRFQFIHDFLSDDDIADVLGMNPNPYRTPALAQAAPPSRGLDVERLNEAATALDKRHGYKNWTMRQLAAEYAALTPEPTETAAQDFDDAMDLIARTDR